MKLRQSSCGSTDEVATSTQAQLVTLDVFVDKEPLLQETLIRFLLNLLEFESCVLAVMVLLGAQLFSLAGLQ